VRLGRLLWGSVIGALTAGLFGASFASETLASSAPLRVIPSCSRFARSPIVYRSRSGQIIVRRGTVPRDGGTHDWACPRSGPAQAWPLGGSVADGFASSETVRGFVSSGPWLVDVVDSRCGWSTCLKPSRAQRCQRYHHEVELVDVAVGSEQSAPSGASVDIHLSTRRGPDGDRIAAVVWTQPASGSRVTLEALTERDSETPGVDSGFGLNEGVTGRIDPRSVRLRGLRVSYAENGHRRSFQLSV
jgi:hypothetical protein